MKYELISTGIENNLKIQNKKSRNKDMLTWKIDECRNDTEN